MDPVTVTIVTGALGGLGTSGVLYVLGRWPKFMRTVERKFKGTRLGIVGPPQAGKTTFLNYLRHGKFGDEYPVLPTTRRSRAFSFNVDVGGDLRFPVREVYDIPGEYSPNEQVAHIRKTGPEALLILVGLDSSRKWDWFVAYLDRLKIALEHEWSIIQRLRCVVVVLNKSDLITARDRKEAIAHAEAVVNEKLTPILQKNVSRVKVVPCTLLRSQGGERSAGAVLLLLLHLLKSRTPLKPSKGR